MGPAGGIFFFQAQVGGLGSGWDQVGVGSGCQVGVGCLEAVYLTILGAPRIEHHCPAGRQHAVGSKHMRDNERSDGRNRPIILVGMESKGRGGPGLKAPRGRHAGRARRRRHHF